MFTRRVTSLSAPSRRASRALRLAAVPVVMVLAATSAADASPPRAESARPATTAASAAAPGLDTSVVMSGLDIPWDIAVLPSGAWLVTERERLRISIRRTDGSTQVLANTPTGFFAAGETGLMSIVADPDVASNSRFYTCAGYRAGGTQDIRVHAWRLNAARTDASIVDTLLSGIQVTTGRHGGCRLRFDRSGRLYVGTGDSAVGTNPQNLRSLNGKVLRLDRFSGRPSSDNPFAGSPYPNKRYILTYGHRNVQGLALRWQGAMWSVEHGTYRDDEVNRLEPGGNYGWNPVPGYNESKPMTDFSLPGRQLGARWSSGDPTIATSGAVWVRGSEWGAYRGTLAVCALGGERLVFMQFDGNGSLVSVRSPAALRGTFGRLRSVVQTADNDLLVTTANGNGTDKIIRVSPR